METRRLLWTVYIIIQALVIMSRLYIAAHFPHQCFLGLFLGKDYFILHEFVCRFSLFGRNLYGQVGVRLVRMDEFRSDAVASGLDRHYGHRTRDLLVSVAYRKRSSVVDQRSHEVVWQERKHTHRFHAVLQSDEIQRRHIRPWSRFDFQVIKQHLALILITKLLAIVSAATFLESRRQILADDRRLPILDCVSHSDSLDTWPISAFPKQKNPSFTRWNFYWTLLSPTPSSPWLHIWFRIVHLDEKQSLLKSFLLSKQSLLFIVFG